MSSGMCGAACAPSTTTTASVRARTSRTISATGFTVPRAFETCIRLTSRVRAESSDGSASSRSRP